MSSAPVSMQPALGPVTRRVRAYFAPVMRSSESPTLFDPSLIQSWPMHTPPAPWKDLGWVRNFTRKSATSIRGLSTGAPSGVQVQTREAIGATVHLQFEQWTKLTMGLASGSQHMNVLAGGGTLGGGSLNGSGSKASGAVALAAAAAAADFLPLNTSDLINFKPGDMVAVDADYTGGGGFVGAGVSAAYVKAGASVGVDADYVRRVTFNVGRVAATTGTGLQLAAPLLGGAPTAGMKVQKVVGFVDREGGSFFQEWSALFAMSGEQGDQLLLHYPRLQAAGGAGEASAELMQPLSQILLDASFRALPVVDSNDGERVYCFRTYVPAGGSAV